ncbi:MAG: MFS transporter [Anaerolineaceae bacterium]|nr:MFS transporter [Anaerolineaceae bacterium]
MENVKLLHALHHRPFAYLWTGQAISRLGDSLYRVALAWWVLEKTHSATAMGAVLVFSSVPMLVFLLFGGVIVDRVDRIRLVLISDLLRGAAVMIIAVLALSGYLEVWHIYLLSILFGLVDAFFQPAYTALVPEMAPTDALPSANALTSLSSQVTGIAGPALGALIVAAGSTSLAFVFDALSFLISAAFLLPLLRQPTRQIHPAIQDLSPLKTIGRDLGEGFRLVASIPWLWVTILVAALANITLLGPLQVTLPFLIQQKLSLGVEALGLVYSLFSVGSVVAALALGSLGRIHRRGLLVYGTWVLSGLLLVAIGLSTRIIEVAVLALIIGAGMSIFMLIWTHTLQVMVPGEKLGRVSSLDILGSYVLLPVGYAIAGIGSDRLGPGLVFIIGGVVTALLAGLGFLHPDIRNLD